MWRGDLIHYCTRAVYYIANSFLFSCFFVYLLALVTFSLHKGGSKIPSVTSSGLGGKIVKGDGAFSHDIQDERSSVNVKNISEWTKKKYSGSWIWLLHKVILAIFSAFIGQNQVWQRYDFFINLMGYFMNASGNYRVNDVIMAIKLKLSSCFFLRLYNI